MNLDNNLAKVKNTTKNKGQARISCPPTLANNLDTLKINFWIDWSDDSFLEEIQSIKESLQRTDNENERPYHCPGDFDWNVQRIGIKLFPFRLLAGDLRLFLNSRSSEGDIPNLRLEIGSESCWAPGYYHIFKTFLIWVRLLGGTVVKEQISEAHLALDIVGLDIQTLNVEKENYWIKRSKHFGTFYEDRKLAGISVGRGAFALRVYDKVKEISRSGNKQNTFSEFWQVSHYSERPVTRVEFQLRRPIFKELISKHDADLSLDTLDDLVSGLNSVWRFCTIHRVRHCSSIVDSKRNHQSRSSNSDFWNIVSSAVWSGQTVYSKQKPRPKKDIVALRKQHAGTAMTIAAFFDVQSEDLDHIISIAKHTIEEDLIALYREDEPKFVKRIEKKKREIYESVSYLHRLKPDHPERGFFPTPYPSENNEGERHG